MQSGGAEWRCRVEVQSGGAVASKLYEVNATLIIFVFVLHCIVQDGGG